MTICVCKKPIKRTQPNRPNSVPNRTALVFSVCSVRGGAASPTSNKPPAPITEMELQGPTKRMRTEDLTAGEPPPRATEATEAVNPGPTTHSKEPPPPRPDGGGGGSGGDDNVDHISGLPDAILGEIVSLLSTKEAGRTRILSSRWRHVWLASPLVLDATDLYTKPMVSPNLSHPGIQKFTATDEAIASMVSLILSAHPGPGRRFCVPPHFLQDRPATVDAWLSSPALVNLQELDFWERGHMKYWYMQVSPLASLPASIFRFSATLQVATLGKCELLDSSVQGIHLPYLKQLGLEDVSISQSSLHTITSSCPVLECLLLKDNFGVGCLRISSNSLRSIGVGANRRRGDLQLLQEVIIVDAPCLERFLYLGWPMNLAVMSAPKLETLGCLKAYGYDCPRLVIGTTTIQGLNLATSLATTLSNVKILAVASDHINIDTVIELMKCFPCLEKLYIKSCISGQMNRWRRKHRIFIKCFDIRLKKIVLEQYRGIRSQVNFASFFLQNARELELMRLEVGTSDYNEAFFADQYGMLQMEKRASRGARLHFTNKICTRDINVNHVRDLSIPDPFECRW